MANRAKRRETSDAAASLLQAAEQALHAMRIGDALALYGQAERASEDPDACAGGRWKCHMLRGNFEEAWLESDAIARRGSAESNRFWDGKPLTGKRVLIRCLHGLGDTLQFIRYAPLLKSCTRGVTIEAQPALRSLLAASGLAKDVITWGEPEGEWDSQIEVVELPRIYRTCLHSIPENVPYLRTAAAPQAPHAYSSDPRLRVGLVWRSSSFNPERSIDALLVAPLFSTHGTRFFNIQTGPEMSELSAWEHSIPMLHRAGDDVLATAKKLQQLDLIITVDTMVAHLAGALALPVWTLLPYRCDWRWMLDRTDSPWYPAMQLIRQPEPGDWPSVIELVRQKLETIAAMGPLVPLQPALQPLQGG